MGDPPMIGFMGYRRGKNAFYLGDWHKARVCCEMAVADVQAIGTSWMSAYLPLGLGHLCLVEGEYESGGAYFNAAIDLAGRPGAGQGLHYPLKVLAQRQLLAGSTSAPLAILR